VILYPYYDIFNESYARLDAMIEKMNKRPEHLISEMRECGLLHETSHSLRTPRHEANLYDDWKFFLPLESFAPSLLVFSYSNHFKMHVMT